MSDPSIIQPNLLPLDQILQDYCNSSDFLINSVNKIAFSSCSEYLAIPKQNIYNQYSVLVIHCSNWHSNDATYSDLYVHNKLYCTSAIWSLAFGRRTSKLSFVVQSSVRDNNFLSTLKTEHAMLSQSRSVASVNRRYDLTKNLFLAAGLADGRVNVWNISTGELTLILKDHQSTVCGLDFAIYNMQLASCSHDTTIKLWDLLDDGNMYKTLNEWTHVINSVKWSPDETLLCAVGPYGLVVLFDTTKWQKVLKLDGHLHNVVDCSFSLDSALLVTASYDTRVLLWSTITGEIIKEFAHVLPIPSKIYAGGDNGAFVRSAIITKSNYLVVTACDDSRVRWFPVTLNRSSKMIFEQTEPNVLCIAATSNEKTMAISYQNGEVHLFSTLSTQSMSQPLSLKYFCRSIINSNCGTQRKNILKLPIPQSLVNYLLYRDIKMK